MGKDDEVVIETMNPAPRRENFRRESDFQRAVEEHRTRTVSPAKQPGVTPIRRTSK